MPNESFFAAFLFLPTSKLVAGVVLGIFGGFVLVIGGFLGLHFFEASLEGGDGSGQVSKLPFLCLDGTAVPFGAATATLLGGNVEAFALIKDRLLIGL